MKRLASFLIWLVISHHTSVQHVDGEDTDFDFQAFKTALVQAYNASKSFSQNFYELLGLICPESVYCQTNGTVDTENTDFRDIVEDETLVPDDFLQNFDQTAISEARLFLRRNANHLPGCCVPCSCNNDCRARRNCCPSMDAQIANAVGSESTDFVQEECVYANSKYYLSLASQTNHVYRFFDTIGTSFFMVIDCASTNVSEDIATKCTHPSLEQADETNPVYSTDVNKIYRNVFCALCNNVSQVTEMSPLVSINHVLSLTGKRTLPKSRSEMYRMVMSNYHLFDMTYTFPSNRLDIKNFRCVSQSAHVLTYSELRDDSNQNQDNKQIYFCKRACEMNQHPYHNGIYIFTNVFCFICYQFGKSQATCGQTEQPDRSVTGTYAFLLGEQHESSIVPTTGTHKDDSSCSCAELLDTSKKVCREIVCPPGMMRNLCDCEPFITNITGMRIKLHLELRPQLPDSVIKERFEGELQTDVPAAIAKAVKRLVASQFGPVTSKGQFLFRPSTVAAKTSLTFHYCEVLILRGSTGDREELEYMFTFLQTGLTKRIIGTTMYISLGPMFDIKRGKTDTEIGTDVVLERLYPDNMPWFDWVHNNQPLKKLVYCKRVQLDEEEVALLHNVTAAVGWPQSYLDYIYWEDDESMCLEDFKAAFMPDESSETSSFCQARPDILGLMIGTWVVCHQDFTP